MKLVVHIRIVLAIAVVCGLVGGALAQRSTSGAGQNAGAQPTQRGAPPERSIAPSAASPSPEHVISPGAVSAPKSERASATSPTLEAARQRWERLSPEERVRARDRYEKYLALSEAERAELAQRAQRLKEDSARLQRDLSPEVRDRLSTLEPAKRHELIGELLESEAREKGQRIRELLPESVVKRLESARPEDRARFLAEFKAQQRKRVARYAIDQLGRRLQLSPQEVERLKNLSDEERAQAVLELRKQISEREAEEFGLPPGLTRREWEAWEALPPEEFFENMQRYRHMRLAQQEAERTHDATAADSRTGESSAAPDSAHTSDAAHDARPARPAPSAESNSASKSAKRDAHETDRARPSSERQQALHELAEARRVRPSDLIDLAPLSKAERAERVAHRRRERCMAAIREGNLLAPERIDELANVSDPIFFESVRRLLATAKETPARAGGEVR
jgi:hypothetical protein